MREFVTKGYKFEELPQNIKDMLVLKYEPFDDWHLFTKEAFHEKLEALGFYNIDSHFSGFWSQGDGASFSARISMENVEKLGYFQDIADKCNLISDKESEFFKEDDFAEFMDSTIKIESSGRYCHEYTMSLEINNKVGFFEFYGHNTLCDFLVYCRDLAKQYYADLETEFEYQTSEENYKEAHCDTWYTIEGIELFEGV